MPPEQDADLDLVARVQRGDDRAFTELLARYEQPVFHFIYRLLSGGPDAEDVAQETFVRAYRALPRFRPQPGVRFSTWLFQIARHAALDHLRRARRRAEVPWPAERADPAAAAAPADEELARRELGLAIARAFAQLPEDQRTALALAEYHGASAAEIADVMSSSVRAAESRVYRARQELRRLLAAWRPAS